MKTFLNLIVKVPYRTNFKQTCRTSIAENRRTYRESMGSIFKLISQNCSVAFLLRLSKKVEYLCLVCFFQSIFGDRNNSFLNKQFITPLKISNHCNKT